MLKTALNCFLNDAIDTPKKVFVGYIHSSIHVQNSPANFNKLSFVNAFKIFEHKDEKHEQKIII